MNQEESYYICSIMLSFSMRMQLLLQLVVISNFFSRMSVTKALRPTPVISITMMTTLGTLSQTVQSPKPTVGSVTMTISKQSLKGVSSEARNRQCEKNTTTAIQIKMTYMMSILLNTTFHANSKVISGLIPQSWMILAARGEQYSVERMQRASGKKILPRRARCRSKELLPHQGLGLTKSRIILNAVLNNMYFCPIILLLLFQQ